MKLYCPHSDAASGYGRLAAACARALRSQLFSSNNVSHDFAITNPYDTSKAPIRLTMWETDALPVEYSGWQNAKVLIVPCEHNRRLFRKYTRKPIEICPLFADMAYENLPPIRPFKFICVARDNGVRARKGIDELLAWFTQAFPRESDVSLTIKQSPHCFKRYTYDKRINIIYEDYDRLKYFQLLAEHHCGVFLSGAEGWNFPANELMALGRPSIIIPHGGPADFTSTDTSWHLPYKLIKAPMQVYRGVGRVAYPDKAGTIAAMREAYGDPLLVAQKALASALRAADYTEARFAARLQQIVARYGFQTNLS